MTPEVGDIVRLNDKVNSLAYGRDDIWGARRKAGQLYIAVRVRGDSIGAVPLEPFVVPDDWMFRDRVIWAATAQWDVVEKATHESTDQPAHLIDGHGGVWVEVEPDLLQRGGSVTRSFEYVIDYYGLAPSRR